MATGMSNATPQAVSAACLPSLTMLTGQNAVKPTNQGDPA